MRDSCSELWYCTARAGYSLLRVSHLRASLFCRGRKQIVDNPQRLPVLLSIHHSYFKFFKMVRYLNDFTLFSIDIIRIQVLLIADNCMSIMCHVLHVKI